ncbi:tRNA-guanine transglycosylase [Nadsonia fulvescens var. elongata DSM 6958]|uniref:tRNA-guanine transglycosylase n=1 Tax=Nadsonia fulvescens var. elongata DSM 6958 TaxID=857566 RepID=A0A1E3PDE2_9ASCO|nr:tRNA-guanine transglycosylase [Nadsonia fulvescens var. elongata DSM 6958]
MKQPKLFSLLKSPGVSWARRGRLEFQPRAGSASSPPSLITPALLTPTTKGTVPHITPDNLDRLLFATNRIQGAHFCLEDFVENIPNVPIFGYPKNSLPSNIRSLNQLFCLPETIPTALSLRRSAFHPLSKSNTDQHLILDTSKGYVRFELNKQLSLFNTIFQSVAPEIFLAPMDLPVAGLKKAPGKSRTRSIVRRNQLWLSQFLTYGHQTNIFAPLVTSIDPMEYSCYAKFLHVNRANVAGLAVYPGPDGHQNKPINYYLQELASLNQSTHSKKTDNDQVGLVEDIKFISELPRYNLRPCNSPHEILELVSKGMDIFNDDISVKYAEAGIALKFQFPVVDQTSPEPFGINIWCDRYRTDTTPINDSNLMEYNWAYVNHLFSAREMLSTILLTIHNTTVMNQVFVGIRDCIENGSFDAECARFRQVYRNQDGTKLYNEALRMMEEHRTKTFTY